MTTGLIYPALKIMVDTAIACAEMPQPVHLIAQSELADAERKAQQVDTQRALFTRIVWAMKWILDYGVDFDTRRTERYKLACDALAEAQTQGVVKP